MQYTSLNKSASWYAGVGMLLLAPVIPAVAMDVSVSLGTVPVEHITMSSAKPYAAVKQNLEARLGKLDAHIRQLAEQKKPDELRAAVEAAAGKDGLVWHYTGTHGAWLVMKGGEPKPVTEYFIGNVVSAAEMTSVNYGAGLYAPLRIVLYANAQGGSTVEYDLPSSQLRQFHSEQIDAVGVTLDCRLKKLVTSILE